MLISQLQWLVVWIVAAVPNSEAFIMYASSTASMNMIPFNKLSHVPPQASVPVFLGGWYVCILQLSWSPPSVILNAIVASFASSYCFWYYWSHHLGLAYGFASSQMVFKGETQRMPESFANVATILYIYSIPFLKTCYRTLHAGILVIEE